jgi:hypothetical protein
MSYKRGLPYVYASESENKDIVVHFWGEYDESYKNTGWSENYKDKYIDLSGIQMSMTDFDEIVIKRVNEIINEDFGTEKYKKIEKMFNEGRKFRFGKREKKELIYDD